ncbi:facilitated trehalose transporter Tret1-2 homolog [Diorhabda carinulata]|uniref:facilitated trehalose transporter Tret1-2 homolog n=1 Tax=Diorhabda carinulata TaxID=1163345 RepID=UPI0025A1749D|nr:facilitated trehalose transporter Tret1-2 homolog [Diorhabda carinulata]
MTIIAFSKHVYFYYACQFVNGCILSAVLVTVPVYNNEIATEKDRTWLGCVVSLGLPIGVLISYILGAVITSFELFTLTSAIPSLLHLVSSYFIVETPMYLASKQRKREALIVLKKLRTYKNDKDVYKEYEYIEDISTNHVGKKTNIFRIFTSRTSRKSLFICIIVTFTQQISGISIILSFMVPIFTEAGAALSPNEISILTGSIQLFVVILVSLIVNKFGKRPLLLFSSFFCSISMLGIGLYFLLKSIELPVYLQLRWLPVVCVITFIISYGLGLGSIPLGYIGELFKQDLRTTGMGVAMLFGGVLVFVLDFGFPLLAEAYGIHVCMFLYGFATFTGFLLLLLFLPETRGESLKSIQRIIESKTIQLKVFGKS